MPKHDSEQSKSLRDNEIATTKKISRRSLLAKTGIGAAALVAASIEKARAGDAKTVDNDRPPTSSDPDRD